VKDYSTYRHEQNQSLKERQMQFFIDTLSEVGEVYVWLNIMVIAYVIGRIKGEKFTE